jgi:hypothetical protein
VLFSRPPNRRTARPARPSVIPLRARFLCGSTARYPGPRYRRCRSPR